MGGGSLVGTVVTGVAVSSPAVAKAGAKVSADPAVTMAVALGWQMAELYQASLNPPVTPREDPVDLPGLSAMGGRQLLGLRFDQISSGLTRLSERVAAGGLSIDVIVRDVDAAARLFGSPSLGDEEETADAAGSRPRPTTTPAARHAVLGLHVQILGMLTAADATVGKAYELGSALADLTLRPTVSDRAAFQVAFSRRIDPIMSRLRDLKTVLPDHAGEAVRMSLESWKKWTMSTEAGGAEWSSPSPSSDPLHPASIGSDVAERLAAQGRRWRAILTGEKLATDVLSADDLVVAGEALLVSVGRIGRRFWAQYRIGIVLGALALTGVVAFLVLGPGGSGGGLGALGAIAAAAGITWKGVEQTLGAAVREVESSLWGAQLDQVVTVAITDLPGSSVIQLEVPKATGFARVKELPQLLLKPTAGP